MIRLLNSALQASVVALGAAVVVGCISLLVAPAMSPMSDTIQQARCEYLKQGRILQVAMDAIGNSRDASEIAIAAKTAKALATGGVRCFPAWGSNWTYLAMLTLAADGPTNEFREYFNRSELTAPSDVSNLKQRVLMLLSLEDTYPGSWMLPADRYLQHALHADISEFLLSLTENQRETVIERMREINTPQIRRWFQNHSD